MKGKLDVAKLGIVLIIKYQNHEPQRKYNDFRPEMSRWKTDILGIREPEMNWNWSLYISKTDSAVE